MIAMTLLLAASMISLAKSSPEESRLTGTARVLKNVRPGTCGTPDRIRICRDRVAVFNLEMNDLRLRGEATLVYDTFTTKSPYSEKSKGYFRMVNDAGAWVGNWQGSINKAGQSLITIEAHGKAGLADMVAHWQMERLDSNWFGMMTINGVVSKETDINSRR